MIERPRREVSLLEVIERRLLERLPITIGEGEDPPTFRYARRGDLLDSEVDGDMQTDIVAREHGVYRRTQVLCEGGVVRHTWLHMGPLEDLGEVIRADLDAMTAPGRAELRVALIAQGALRNNRPSSRT